MNKAITKRLLSLVLLVVMLVGCALPAYAADTGASGDLTAVYAQEGTSYKDGVYEGTGKGFKNGEIKVKVTITDGKIAKVELVSQEKQSYWETMNVASLFDDIVKANGTEIDGVSGATMSSNGVKAAVNDALSKALVTEPEQPDTGIFAAGTGAKSDPYLIRTSTRSRRSRPRSTVVRPTRASMLRSTPISTSQARAGRRSAATAAASTASSTATTTRSPA